MIKIIIFGGSFNPITYAHIGMAKLASQIYTKAQLYWCLGDTHNFKDELSPYDFRMSLIQKAVPDASIIPMGKYMWDFLISLPYNPKETTILIGGDILNEIHKWKNWEELISTYHFTIVRRMGIKSERISLDNMNRMNYNIYTKNIVMTSSSEVRQAVKEGKPTYDMIPRQIKYEVEKYYVN